MKKLIGLWVLTGSVVWSVLAFAQGPPAPPSAGGSTVQTVAPTVLPNWTPASSVDHLVAKRGQTVTITVIASVDLTTTVLSGCTADVTITDGRGGGIQHMTGKTGPDGQAKFPFLTARTSYAGAYYYTTSVMCSGVTISDAPNYGGTASSYRVFVVQ